MQTHHSPSLCKYRHCCQDTKEPSIFQSSELCFWVFRGRRWQTEQMEETMVGKQETQVKGKDVHMATAGATHLRKCVHLCTTRLFSHRLCFKTGFGVIYWSDASFTFKLACWSFRRRPRWAMVHFVKTCLQLLGNKWCQSRGGTFPGSIPDNSGQMAENKWYEVNNCRFSFNCWDANVHHIDLYSLFQLT